MPSRYALRTSKLLVSRWSKSCSHLNSSSNLYVDYCLCVPDSVEDAIEFKTQLHDLFLQGVFFEMEFQWFLRTWTCWPRSQGVQISALCSSHGRVHKNPGNGVECSHGPLFPCLTTTSASEPHQMYSHLWCSQNVWRIRLVCSCHHQSEDFLPAPLGARIRLGWSCTTHSKEQVVEMELSFLFSHFITFLDATFQKRQKSSPQSCIDSLMPLKLPMLE